MNEVIQLFEFHCRSITFISIFHRQRKKHLIELKNFTAVLSHSYQSFTDKEKTFD